MKGGPQCASFIHPPQTHPCWPPQRTPCNPPVTTLTAPLVIPPDRGDLWGAGGGAGTPLLGVPQRGTRGGVQNPLRQGGVTGGQWGRVLRVMHRPRALLTPPFAPPGTPLQAGVLRPTGAQNPGKRPKGVTSKGLSLCDPQLFRMDAFTPIGTPE